MSTAKFWVSALMAVLAAVVPGLTDGMDAAAWINVIALGAGAVMVFTTSNDAPGWGAAKSVAAVVAAAAVVLASAVTGGIDAGEWMQVAAAVLGALGVYAVPNKSQYDLAG